MCDKHKFVFEFDKAYTARWSKSRSKPRPSTNRRRLLRLKRVSTRSIERASFVYAGKAMRTTLRRRLAEHARKITSRRISALGKSRADLQSSKAIGLFEQVDMRYSALRAGVERERLLEAMSRERAGPASRSQSGTPIFRRSSLSYTAAWILAWHNRFRSQYRDGVANLTHALGPGFGK